MKINKTLLVAAVAVACLAVLAARAWGCEYVRVAARGPSFIEIAMPMRLLEEESALKVRLASGRGEDEWYVYRNAPLAGERTVDGTLYRWKLSFRNGRQSEDFAPCVLEGTVEIGAEKLKVSRVIELTPFRKKGARVMFQVRNLSILLRNTDASEVVPGDAELPAAQAAATPDDGSGAAPSPSPTPSGAGERIVYISTHLRVTFMDKFEPAARFSLDALCPYCSLPFREH